MKVLGKCPETKGRSVVPRGWKGREFRLPSANEYGASV